MKRFFYIFLAAVLCLTCAMPVLAAPEESDLVYLDEAKSIVFWVEWDKEKPSVVFLAPDGTEYDPAVTREDTTTVESGTSLYYIILDAQAGQWRVRMDKGSNEKVEISTHDYNLGIFIEKFEIGTVDGNYIPVSFQISGDDDNRRINYRISAVVDRGGEEKELDSGTARVNRAQSQQVRLSSLSTYDSYMLKLYVWYDDNGTDIFDIAFSPTFAYTNASIDEKVTDFSMVIEPETQLVYVSWEDLNWTVDGVMVALFENNNTEPSVFDEYDKSEGPIQLSYDPAATEVSVEFTVNHDGVYAQPMRKTAKLGAQMALQLPAGDSVNSLQLPMTYQGLTQQKVFVVINDKNTELILDGSGIVNLALQEDWNTLQVSYTDAAGVTWQISRSIYVDRKPPILTLDRNYDGMVLAKDTTTITISGTATDCQLLTVNGEAVAVGKTGTFTKDVAVNNGTNTITVVATDGAGNESRYTATVTRGKATTQAPGSTPGKSSNTGNWYETITGPGSFWPLLIASVLCVMVIGYALIFWRKPKARDNSNNE